MLSFDEALAHLLGWIGRDVRVIVQPGLPHEPEVIVWLAGDLNRGVGFGGPHAVLGDVQDDEVMFFYVGPSDDVEGSHFIVPRARFESARIEQRASGETLVITLQGASLSVRLAD